MLHRSLLLTALFVPLLLLPAAGAGESLRTLPEQSYRLDLAVRKPGEKEVTKETRKVAVDVFRDRESKRLLYVGEWGTPLAVLPIPAGGLDKEMKAPKPSHRLLLPVRKVEEKEFGEKTPKISVEVYRDENAGNWVYVSHTGSVAVTPAEKAAAEKEQAPKWVYRLPLKVRDPDFEAKPHPLNVEVYRDENTGVFVYVAENGNLSVLPAGKAEVGQKPQAPKWSHAGELRTRKPGEELFNKDTRKISLEVYEDANRGAWVYITRQFNLVAVPKTKDAAEVKQWMEWTWLEGLLPAGAAAKDWSAEVFLDERTDYLVYVNVSGGLAVVSRK